MSGDAVIWAAIYMMIGLIGLVWFNAKLEVVEEAQRYEGDFAAFLLMLGLIIVWPLLFVFTVWSKLNKE